jgi:hypothetical protein
MTQDEIIEMARQAGFILEQPSLDTWCALGKEFEAFAKLVAAKEREACAKVCEDYGTHNITINCAAAIRARSISRGEA